MPRPVRDLGYSYVITPKGAADVAAYGVPVYDFGNVNSPATKASITALDKKIAAIGTPGEHSNVGAVDLRPILDSINQLPAEIRRELASALGD